MGWKRPASTATVMIKNMIDNKENKKSSIDDGIKRKKMDKEIYLEAIYKYFIVEIIFKFLKLTSINTQSDDVAGQIFKKYLISRNKSVSLKFRLKDII